MRCPNCGEELEYVLSVEYTEYCEKYKATVEGDVVKYGEQVDCDFVNGEIERYECPYCGEELAKNEEELKRIWGGDYENSGRQA